MLDYNFDLASQTLLVINVELAVVALMKFLLIVTRREATGGNRIISDTVQPNFRPAFYYTLCAVSNQSFMKSKFKKKRKIFC